MTGPVKVKICGVRSVENALAAAGAGADLLGFNFAPVSRRRIDQSVARKAIDACRRGSSGTQMAGVFVNQPLEEVIGLAGDLGLDWVQLSGDEDEAYCAAIAERTEQRVIKAVRLARPDESAQIEALGGCADVLLADATVPGSYGGSGQAWDWKDAAGVAGRHDVLLAGGLTPDNVALAIAAVRPWGVDVASGVETGGQIDPVRVRAFIRHAKGDSHGQHS